MVRTALLPVLILPALIAIALAVDWPDVAVAAARAAPAATPAAAPIATIPLAGVDAAAVATPSAATAWGGARTAAEATLSDRVVEYQIKTSLDPQHHIVDGMERLTWRNRSAQTVAAVYLHLYLNAFEGEQSTFRTEAARKGYQFRTGVAVKTGDWGHIEMQDVRQNGAVVPVTFVHPDGGPITDHTVVRLDLPEPVAAGASTSLDIKFQDQLPRVIARTGYFGTFHLVGQWFPKIAVLELPGERGSTRVQWNAHEFHLDSEFYADYGVYDVEIKVPEHFVVGAVGEEIGAPVTTAGFTTHHFVQADVHDFAWTADSRFSPPIEGIYTGPGSPTVKVRVLFPPEYKGTADQVLKTTIEAIGFFSRHLGPYPYKTVTAVMPPNNAEEAAGMEYPTFFTTEGHVSTEPGSLTHDSTDFTAIHEFGHGYFYGILGSNEFEEPMLDEGLNEYWDQRMMEQRKDPFHISTPLMNRLGLNFDIGDMEIERLLALLHQPPDSSGANAWQRISSFSYVSLYARTALLLHDMQQLVGTAAMDKAFMSYYEQWKFRHPSVADFREALANNVGQPDLVDKTFAQQVYNVRRIDDAVESIDSEEVLPLAGTHQDHGRWVETSQADIEKQVEADRAAWRKEHPKPAPGTGPYPFRTTVTLRRYGAPVPQILQVQFADGSSEVAVWNDAKRWARFSWTKPVQAISAEINANHEHLLDADTLNDSRSVATDRKASLRLTGDLATWFQSLFAWWVAQ